MLEDDLKTPQGMVEGTAVSFANAWMVESNCPVRSVTIDDPCSYSSVSSKTHLQYLFFLLCYKEEFSIYIFL